MQYRVLGSTGIRVSVVSFGAGPVPALLTSSDVRSQRDVVARAIKQGINWFDTAATYGAGQSERSLGVALEELGRPTDVHVATKVRLMDEHLVDIAGSVKSSVAASLKRLRLERVTLLQLHNSVTAGLGDEPTSLTPSHVLCQGGVLEAMQDLQQAGMVEHLGLTGLGQPAALLEVIDSAALQTIQIPYNLLNRSAGENVAGTFKEANYGNLITECGKRNMGVFAIRVLAGGAMVDQEPSAHTLTTKFFPLDLYERDRRRARSIERELPRGLTLKDAAVRFVLSHPNVTSAIVGLSSGQQIDEAVRFAEAGPLEPTVLDALRRAADRESGRDTPTAADRRSST